MVEGGRKTRRMGGRAEETKMEGEGGRRRWVGGMQHRSLQTAIYIFRRDISVLLITILGQGHMNWYGSFPTHKTIKCII